MPALLRLAVADPESKQKLFQIFAKQLLPNIAKVVPAENVAIATALIATQAIGLAFARCVIEIPLVVSLTDEQILASVGGTFQRYLDQASALPQRTIAAFNSHLVLGWQLPASSEDACFGPQPLERPPQLHRVKGLLLKSRQQPS